MSSSSNVTGQNVNCAEIADPLDFLDDLLKNEGASVNCAEIADPLDFLDDLLKNEGASVRSSEVEIEAGGMGRLLNPEQNGAKQNSRFKHVQIAVKKTVLTKEDQDFLDFLEFSEEKLAAREDEMNILDACSDASGDESDSESVASTGSDEDSGAVKPQARVRQDRRSEGNFKSLIWRQKLSDLYNLSCGSKCCYGGYCARSTTIKDAMDLRENFWGDETVVVSARKSRREKVQNILENSFCQATSEFTFAISSRKVCEIGFLQVLGLLTSRDEPPKVWSSYRLWLFRGKPVEKIPADQESNLHWVKDRSTNEFNATGKKRREREKAQQHKNKRERRLD